MINNQVLNSELVRIENKQPVTNSYIIAKWADRDHREVTRIITRNIDILKRFGGVDQRSYPLKTNGGVQQIKATILNEEQAMFVILSMRNNEKTKQFKVELIKAFKQCREQLAKQNQLLTEEKYANNKGTAHELASGTGSITLGLKKNSLVYEYIKLKEKIKANKAQWEQELKEFDSVIDSAFELSEDLKALSK